MIDYRKRIAVFATASVTLAALILLPLHITSITTTALVDDYAGWRGCFRMENGHVSLMVVPAVARVMDFHRVGGANLFWRNCEFLGRSADLMEGNQIFGGAKLWVAPQSEWNSVWGQWPPCPLLDAGPCTALAGKDGSLKLRGHGGSRHGVRFDRTIRLLPDIPAVRLNYSMTNITNKPVAWGIWSVIQLRPGGRIIVPCAESDMAWQGGQSSISHWMYADGLWSLTHTGEKSKLYVTGKAGWVGYVLDDTIFALSGESMRTATFPAGEAGIEVFTDPLFIELEHISPLYSLQPGEEAEMKEEWYALPTPEGVARMPTAMLYSWIKDAVSQLKPCPENRAKSSAIGSMTVP